MGAFPSTLVYSSQRNRLQIVAAVAQMAGGLETDDPWGTHRFALEENV
jgi:hypothetical protein